MAEASACIRFRRPCAPSGGVQEKALIQAFAKLHYVFDMPPTAGGARRARVNDGNTDRLKFRVFRMRCQDLLSGRDEGRRGIVSSNLISHRERYIAHFNSQSNLTTGQLD